MKKRIILMMLFMLSLYVVVGCGGDVSSSETQEDSQQTESELPDISNQGDIQESETTQENVPVVEDGWTELTDEELAWFNVNFFNNPENQIVNYFLDNEFTDVKDVDLYRLFYDLPQTSADSLTDNELNLLENAGVDIGLDVQKVPEEYMDEVIKTYTNIHLEDTNKVKLDLFVYLVEYDAYYMSRGDCHYTTRTMQFGQKDKNGVVRLQYEGYDFSQYEVTLTPHENGYYFVSNIKLQ